MAVPDYTYLMLKIPRPNGIITIKGSFTLSDNCDREFKKISQSFGMAAEYTKLKDTTEVQITMCCQRQVDPCQIKLLTLLRTQKRCRFTQTTQRRRLPSRPTSVSLRKACSSSSSVSAGNFCLVSS
jgi:hypothetical protein